MLAKGYYPAGSVEGESYRLAQQELEADEGQPENPKALLSLGDGWWNLAESLTGAPKENIRKHAAEVYRKTLPQLTGLDKARVERRVGEGQVINMVGRWTLTFPKQKSQSEWEFKPEGVVTNGKRTGRWAVTNNVLRIEWPDNDWQEFTMPQGNGRGSTGEPATLTKSTPPQMMRV